jgi:hypothetical protein
MKTKILSIRSTNDKDWSVGDHLLDRNNCQVDGEYVTKKGKTMPVHFLKLNMVNPGVAMIFNNYEGPAWPMTMSRFEGTVSWVFDLGWSSYIKVSIDWDGHRWSDFRLERSNSL